MSGTRNQEPGTRNQGSVAAGERALLETRRRALLMEVHAIEAYLQTDTVTVTVSRRSSADGKRISG